MEGTVLVVRTVSTLPLVPVVPYREYRTGIRYYYGTTSTYSPSTTGSTGSTVQRTDQQRYHTICTFTVQYYVVLRYYHTSVPYYGTGNAVLVPCRGNIMILQPRW
jgi:hypothetical protein